MDLSALLDAWPFEPGKLNVRLITGMDGTEKLQIRLDLGVLQMNLDGRPDGLKPAGYPSVLEYFEALHDSITQGGPPPPPRSELGLIVDRNPDESEAAQDKPEPDQKQDKADEELPAFSQGVAFEPEPPADQFVLTPSDAKLIRDETIQVYHRYVAMLVLEDFDRVIRDTTRNLRALEFMAEHASNEADRQSMEPYRAYITMMQARAIAGQALEANEPKAAILAIDQALEALRDHFSTTGDMDTFDQAGEVQALRAMRASLVPKLPVSQKTELQQRLNEALESENYELAAILRDELGQLHE